MEGLASGTKPEMCGAKKARMRTDRSLLCSPSWRPSSDVTQGLVVSL